MLYPTSIQALVQAATPSFTETLMASFRDAFSMILSAIPRILGFIVVVAIGWFVSSILARAVMGLLKAIRFDELMQKSKGSIDVAMAEKFLADHFDSYEAKEHADERALCGHVDVAPGCRRRARPCRRA